MPTKAGLDVYPANFLKLQRCSAANQVEAGVISCSDQRKAN